MTAGREVSRLAKAAHEDTDDAELMRHYEAALRRFFGRRLRGAEEIDDLVQEAFARLLESRERRDVEYPIAYLFRIASNLLADQSRRHARRPPQDALDEQNCLASVDPKQEEARHLADLRASLDSALSELSPRCRQIFVMRRFENLSTPAISRSLGITDRMVQKHLARAMSHLYLRLNSLLPRGVSRHAE